MFWSLKKTVKLIMQLTIRKPAKSMLGSVPVDVAAKLLKIIASFSTLLKYTVVKFTIFL